MKNNESVPSSKNSAYEMEAKPPDYRKTTTNCPVIVIPQATKASILKDT